MIIPETHSASNGLNIGLMQEKDKARWDAFVLSCPTASFFHKAGWQEVIQRSFGHKTWFYYAETEGKIVGVLPLAEVKSALFGHSLSSLPFCVYGGVATQSEAARLALTQAAIDLAEKLKVGHLELRSILAQNQPAAQEPGENNAENPPEALNQPAISEANSKWMTKDLYVTFRKEIDADEEKNMLAIPRKQRAMVRKGIKLGLTSEIDQTIDRFFFAYASSVHRLGTPVFSKKYFRILKQVFAEDCEILSIVKDDQIVASVMSFYFRDEVLPYYGGGTPAARDLAGNDFMYWELMRRSCARGYKVFDFGRSKLGTGAYDFKKNWGFEATPLEYEYHLCQATSLPDNNPLNPKYQLFIKLWQRMPIAFANLIGPHIVKNLG